MDKYTAYATQDTFNHTFAVEYSNSIQVFRGERFSRAFKTWADSSPRDYRNGLQCWWNFETKTSESWCLQIIDLQIISRVDT